MNYWLLRSKWGTDDRTKQFIQNDEWQNGYDGKYIDIVNRIEEGDILFLADNSLLNYYGICVSNEKDGRHITVDNWKKFQQPIVFLAKGAYIKRIVKINDDKLLEKSKRAIEKLQAEASINIKSINLKNFTLFKDNSLNFSTGLNIIIGENGTGKTQLIKLIYALTEANNNLNRYKDAGVLEIEEKLRLIFHTNLENLISKKESISSIVLDFDKYNFLFNFKTNGIGSFSTADNTYNKKALFIPAKEMLSFYTGFLPIYNQTSFDETFRDLAINLGKLVPKNRVLEKFEENILQELETILDGKIILDNDRFYLLEKDGNKRDITLVAEGARKVGTIFHLLANGTIEKGSVVFWDEPESNLNPKYIKYVAKILLELERAGIQIFIATHSLFLVNEIEILRKKENQVKYFSFGFDNNQQLRVSQNSHLEELKDLVILDEEIDQGDRFMYKEQDR